jgi:hypothetical protein
LDAASFPIAVLLKPVVIAHKVLQPMAVLPVPEVSDFRALSPRAVVPDRVQPNTMPLTSGVAQLGATELHTTLFEPVDVRA